MKKSAVAGGCLFLLLAGFLAALRAAVIVAFLGGVLYLGYRWVDRPVCPCPSGCCDKGGCCKGK